MTAAVIETKSKSIDRYIADSPKKRVNKIGSIEMWPEGEKPKLPLPKEEDLYGYEDAAPTRRRMSGHHNPSATPRRSSLKGSGDGTTDRVAVTAGGGSGGRRHSITFSDNLQQVREVEPTATMVQNPGRRV
ncbi:MAG: hypothetical protein SGARI_001221 [Bacillariaceae sp.]